MTHNITMEPNKMSIGACNVLLSLFAKPSVKSTYCCKGLQVKQVLGGLISLGIVFIFLVTNSEIQAGVIKGPYQRATAEKYFNWTYAQKVWFEMNTYEKEEAEWKKCSAVFEPWLERYQKDSRAAFKELDKMPKPERLKIQQCYDIQLAHDQWADHIYWEWYNSYSYAASQGKAWTFDEQLAVYAKRATCTPEKMLDECGPVPDWRSPEKRAQEQEMMAKAQAAAAARRR